jgi:uncharacterized OsmC-like protein
MRSDELKALQSPLKQRYREAPADAVVTLRAEGRIGEALACRVDTAKGLVDAGLHPATGGDGSQACSGNMLLEALAACAGVTLSAVATALDVPIAEGRIVVEGDLDFRGTLGVVRDAPVGFRDIRLRFELRSHAPSDQIANVIRLTERYCVVLQTLRQPPAVTVETKP